MAKINDTIFKDWQDRDTMTAYELKREREIIRTAINDNFERIIALGGFNAEEKLNDLQRQIDELDDVFSTDAERIAAINDVINQFTLIDNEFKDLLLNKANKSDVYTKTETDVKYLNKSDVSLADIKTATDNANTEAGYAHTMGDYAKTQGDYAKYQAERAKDIVDQTGLLSTADIGQLVAGFNEQGQVLDKSGNVVEGKVKSVNGKDGVVDLTAEDVGAETPEGAQEKADQALQDAKDYADSIGDGIIQQPTEPDGIEEGRLWLDTSDETYQGTVFEELKKDIGIRSLLETDDKSSLVAAINEIKSKEAEVDTSNLATKTELQSVDDKVDTHLADYEQEVKSNLPLPMQLNRGQQILEVERKTPVNVLSFKGKTTVNLAPLFDSGLWTAVGGGTWVENSPSKSTLTATASFQHKTIRIPMKANQQIVISWLGNGKGAYRSLDSTLSVIGSQASYSASPIVITTPANAAYVDLFLGNGGDGAGTFTIENVTINEGATAQPFTANVKGITNPTIEVKGKNLLKGFSDWKPRTSGLTYVVNEPYNVKMTAITADDFLYFDVVLPPNTKYTYSADSHKIGIALYDKEGKLIGGDGWTSSPNTFTTPSNIAYGRFYVGNNGGATGDYTFKNPMLNIGTTALPFEPNKDQSITLLGTFHEGDEVTGDTVTRKKKEVVLDGGLDWSYNGVSTGQKRVKCTISGARGANTYEDYESSVIAKYDGKIIKVSDPALSADTHYINKDNKNLVLSIPNSDSGFGQDYTPTADEIKAYFMGWRMYNGNDDTPYTSGTKYWRMIPYKVGDTTIQNGRATATLPTTTYPEWQPYRLLYDLANPTPEKLQTIGSISLHEGDNAIELTEGRVVRERVVPQYTIGMGERFYINQESLENSKLKNKTSMIMAIYKNGKLDSSGWTIENHAHSYGNQRAFYPRESFDPTAIYEVDYIPLEPYKLTTETNPITIEYNTKLNGVVGELVEKNTELEKGLQEVFLYGGSGKRLLETTLLAKNAVVSKRGVYPTFGELNEAIKLLKDAAKVTELYTLGDEKTTLTGGWVATDSLGSGTQSKASDSLVLTTDGTGTAQRVYRTSKAIDFTNIDTLYFDWETTSNATNGSVTFGLVKLNEGYPTNVVSSHNVNNVTFPRRIDKLDVSALSGLYQIACNARRTGANAFSVNLKVYKVWGEK